MCCCDLCRSICCCDAKNIFRIVFMRNGVFSRRRFDINSLMQKYHILPNLTVQSQELKKLQRDDRFNMKKNPWNCRISHNYAFWVIHFRIRISWNKSEEKSAFILILCLFLDGTSSKIERDGKLFRKKCQNFTSRVLSRWLSEDVTYSVLLINKNKSNRYKKVTIFKKMER